MKKRSISRTVIVFPVFFIMLFLVYQIHLSLLSRSRVIHSTKSPETRLWKSKEWQEDPSPPAPLQPPKTRQISCDRSHWHYDLCKINAPTVLDPRTSTFFLVDSTIPTPPQYIVEKIRPYPRKWENFTMSKIKEITLTTDPLNLPCKAQHNAPALVFSAGGYTGNFFHDFNDGFIPLFITINSIYPNNQDFVLVISKARDWWVSKYADILHAFSKYPIINLDKDTSTHCFPSATLGLISHGFMTISPTLIPKSQTFTHFRAFLAKAYGHAQNHQPKFTSPKLRPRLVLASRSGGVGRVILNQIEVKKLAQNVGFDVIIFEPKPSTPLSEAYALINSSHAMVGVHGAALTHSLFLRPGSVLMQVVPLGTNWVSKACFENSARAMKLQYIEYKIGANESSLMDKYDNNTLLIQDPVALTRKKWSSAIMDIYLKEQNVRLDLVRFKKYLKEVYNKAKEFMKNED